MKRHTRVRRSTGVCVGGSGCGLDCDASGRPETASAGADRPSAVSASGPAARRLHVQHFEARRAIGPQAGEVLLLRLHAGRILPAGVDVDALPVALPAGRRLVQAAVPGDAVASPSSTMPAFSWKMAPSGTARRPHCRAPRPSRPDGRARSSTPRVPRRRRLPHPAARAATAPSAVPPAPATPRRARWRRFPPLRGCSPPAAACGRRCAPALRCPRRQRQGAGAEVAGKPVVAHGVLQRRNVEQAHQIAVVRRVAQAPVSVAEHGRSIAGRTLPHGQHRGASARCYALSMSDAQPAAKHSAIRHATSMTVAREREEILRLLRRHKPAARERFGVARLSIFGSVARGNAAPAKRHRRTRAVRRAGHQRTVLRPAVLAGGPHRTRRRSGDGKGAAARVETLRRARPHRCLIRTTPAASGGCSSRT